MHEVRCSSGICFFLWETNDVEVPTDLPTITPLAVKREFSRQSQACWNHHMGHKLRLRSMPGPEFDPQSEQRGRTRLHESLPC